MITQKICLVGDFGVGKTSLIRQFVDRQFSDQYLSTVGVKISKKQIELSKDVPPDRSALQLLIWDIEGRTRFKAIAPTYLQGAKGAIVVGDATREETLDQLAEHIQQFITVNPKGWIVVALNKSDLVSADRLDEWLRIYSFQAQPAVLAVYPTSAKTGDRVDQLFEHLAYPLAQK